MNYLGDYTQNYATLNFKFTTRAATGGPSALTGGAVNVYKANSTTESNAGVVLTADFDGVTGLNNVLIDLSANAFYAVANDYAVVLTAGTVDGVSVAGEVLATFSVQNRYMRGTDGANVVAPATPTNVTDVVTATAAAILATPANKLATDGNGKVTYANAAPPTPPTAGENATAAAAAILATPANKLATDGNGKVTYANAAPPTPPTAAENATAVWATTTRTLSSFGTLVSDTAGAAATAVWAASTRTLTSFGTLVASVAGAILKTPANLLKTNAAGQVEASNVMVAPVTFSGTAATYTFAGAANLPFDVPQNAETAIAGQVLDAAGEAVDLGSAELVFRAVDSAGEDVFRLTEGAGVETTGAGDGEVTVTVSAENAAESGTWRYEFWDVAAPRLLAKGAFVVRSTFGPGT